MNVISTRSIEIAAGMAADPAVRPTVKEWMHRAAERHIRKSLELLQKIVSRHQIEDEIGRNSRSKNWKLSKEASRALVEKLSIQLAAGTDFYVFDFNRNPAFDLFLAESRQVLDWLDAIPESDRHLKRIDRVSFEEAATISTDWHRRLLELSTKSEAEMPEEIEVCASWEDGCRVVELKGPFALLREGNLMSHCVGGPGYIEAIQKGTARIFSLRDPSNRPHVTIEVRRSYRRKALCAEQIKGRGRRTVAGPPIAESL
jgi:PcfJ-like protein